MTVRIDGSADEPTRVEIVRDASDSAALVVRVPAVVSVDRPHRFEVARGSRMRATVVVNDARPGWFLPRKLPVAGQPPGLTREIKIVGRNLDAAPGATARVRLRSAARTFALLEVEVAPGLAEFVLRAAVPDNLAPGEYAVEVSRDSRVWVALADRLQILPPAAARSRVDVDAARFGGCRANDARDDTHCLVAALREAARTRGIVALPAGTWRLDDPGVADPDDGVVIANGVDLEGAANPATRIVRSAAWQHFPNAPLFTLAGENRIARIEFAAETSGATAAFLQLGRYSRGDIAAARGARDFAIVGNSFAGSALSIRAGGLPLANLTITGNRLTARRLALALGGDSRNVRDTFRIEDAIVTGNRFEPGGYLDVAIGQGARAAEFGAGERVDFSGNEADGAARRGLDQPGDVPGWRAAFFWHLLGPQERLLISDNAITCSGDKAGDGEAIALDNNHNTFALDEARNVFSADTTRITVQGPLRDRQRGSAVGPEYYRGHWVQIAAGPGVGQSRRIVDVSADDHGRFVFTVAPAWDVVPTAASRVTVARQFWQTYVVGNRIDHRSPLCAKSNRTAPLGGAISVWGQTSDSSVAFNRQFDTNGIMVQHVFSPHHAMFQYFLELRGNEIIGDYDVTRPRGSAGIFLSHGTARDGAPPIASFGMQISGNTIARGRAASSAAIAIVPTWYRGPPPHRWPLIDRVLVFGNALSGGTGIDVRGDSLTHRLVFADNMCRETRRSRWPSRDQALCLDADCRCGD